ncbi:MAG: DUF192 domain-containing protein, partial [Chloroflexota bacterium]
MPVLKSGAVAAEQAINVTRSVCLANRLEHADSFLTRLRGLLGRDRLPPGEGLLISHCTSVHSIGMAFTIDVLHLDRHGCVKRVLHNMKPGRLGPWVPSGASVLELPAGAAAGT